MSGDQGVVDLRSDTLTMPSDGMRRAMAAATVGDDVFGEDPTVNRLQERVAELLGKETALFVPSGTMGNQTAIKALTEPGDEILAHPQSHIYLYESGAPFALSGCSIRFLEGPRGMFDAEQVRQAINPPDAHYARTRLVVVENSHNRGGGSVWPVEHIAAIREVADAFDLRMHLDGARLMNACVAAGRRPDEYARYFDTVSICFSKGLGAPVGSAVAGSNETIRRVHRLRKMFGGGMRQVGILAAAALYALDHHVERLAEDHANARRLARGIAEIDGLTLDPEEVETNMVFFTVSESLGSAAEFCARLDAAGVRMLLETSQRIRAVTHLGVGDDGINRTVAALRSLAN